MGHDEISTLVDVLRRAGSLFAARGYHYPTVNAFLSFDELFVRSATVAQRLRAGGLRRGQTVGLLLKASPRFMTCFFGIQRAGGIPVPLAVGSPKEAFERVQAVIADADMAHLIVEDQMMTLLSGLCPEGLRPWSADALVAADGPTCAEEPLIDPSPEDLAFIQYTSGSTSAPKGVAITHANAVAGLRAIQVSAKLTSDDVLCHWLPHFHDMGLIGNLLTGLYIGAPTHVWPPSSFIKNPSDWIAYFAKVKARCYTGPNFSLRYLVDEVDDDEVAALDLSSLRLVFCGAEPIDVRTLTAFADKFAAAGFRREALYPVYGLAEVVLAATFPEPGEPIHIDWVDSAALGNERRVVRADRSAAGARGVVAVGRAVEGIDLRITSETGEVLGEDRVGEIELSGPAVMQGYYRNPSVSAEVRRDGWLRTGDLGYCKDGRLYIAGRAKEVLKHRGESYYPEDIESVVRGLDGVHRGGCVAFVGGSLGDERIVCMAEADSSDGAQLETLAGEIGKAVRRVVGLGSLDVMLVKKRSIARTSSGKLQRLVMKQRASGSMDSVLYQARV
jgi:acyl-CoA synthetase (AMP-forming)/AMP-acid ligase II